MNNIKQFKSFLSPALTVINGKKYIIPNWIEVPIECTLEDVYSVWVRIETPIAPGRYAKDEDIKKFLSGTYNPTRSKNTANKEFVIKSSRNDSTYTVSVHNNYWSCTCKGFGFRHRCKHIEEAKQK